MAASISGCRCAGPFESSLEAQPTTKSSPIQRVALALAGRYEVRQEIGRGGMGEVYLALDLRHDRQVAVKVLKPVLASTIGPDRFLREIQITARLDHPGIIPLLDSGQVNGVFYYIMPYVAGESLRARLQREKQLPIVDALRIAREVADALSHAHTQGIVHRDVKPENILLSAGHARLVDFGLAHCLTAADADGLTGAGLAMGTPVYSSPEQAAGGQEVDGRADIYSLGCVLYEMLSGEAPFTGSTAAVIQARKSLEAVPGLRIVRDTVHPSVEGVVMRALARIPADRFASARELGAALEDVGPEAPTRRRRIAGFFDTLLTIAGHPQ
jgi:serine/threonine-protein kinase